MKKIFTIGMLSTALFLTACSSQNETKEKASSSNDKTETIVKADGSDSYEHGYEYGKNASEFDHKNFNKQDAKFHDGSAWSKEYSKGYYEGYEANTKANNY